MSTQKTKNSKRKYNKNKKYSKKKSLNYTPLQYQNNQGWADELDSIINGSGQLSIDEYDKLLKDIQVSVGVDTIMAFLLSKDYNITSASDDPQDIFIADFIDNMLNNMDTPFRTVRKNIYTALLYGFSVQEKIYDRDKDGYIVLKDLRPLHIRTLVEKPFIYDNKGNLKGIHQESTYGSVDLPLDKVFIYSFKSYFNQVNGGSILDNLAKIVRIKEKVIEWLVIYLHKHENPLLYAKIANANEDTAQIVGNMLDQVMEGRTSITVGNQDDLGILESQHRGDAFFATINYLDKQIFRNMYIGTLLFGDNKQTGSYAQSRVHLEITTSVFNGLHEEAATEVQRDIINSLVAWNFGEDVKPPLFSFSSFMEKDMLGLLNALAPYANAGLIDLNAPEFNELIGVVLQQFADIKVDRVKKGDEFIKNNPNLEKENIGEDI